MRIVSLVIDAVIIKRNYCSCMAADNMAYVFGQSNTRLQLVLHMCLSDFA